MYTRRRRPGIFWSWWTAVRSLAGPTLAGTIMWALLLVALPSIGGI